MTWRPNGPSEILPGTPLYDLKAHLTYVQGLWRAYKYNTPEKCFPLVRELVANAPEGMRDTLIEFVADFLDDNEIFILEEPTLEFAPYLKRMQARLTLDPDLAIEPMRNFLRMFFDNLPIGESDITLAFWEIIDPTEFIGFCSYSFYTQKVGDIRLFDEFARTFDRNIIEASGHDFNHYEGKGKLKRPCDFDEPADQVLVKFLKNTRILDILDIRIPFKIPTQRFQAHAFIVAPPEHGKTQLLQTFCKQFLAEGVGMVVLDPHGDLFNTLRARVPPDRLVVLDPETNPPPLNFLDFKNSSFPTALQTFDYLMSSLSGGLSDKQAGLTPYLLRLILKIENPTLLTLKEIVDERVKHVQQSAFYPYIQQLAPADQSFFANQFYTNRMNDTKEAMGWKIAAAIAQDTFREMFSSPVNSFEPDRYMDEGKVVLVKGARNAIGDGGMQIFLQFIVGQMYTAALRRDSMAPEKRKLCVLVVDEAEHVFNSQTARILTECRKYGLGSVWATQVIDQIPDDVKAAMYGATAIKVAGNVQYNDAATLAREMYCDTDFIRSCRSRPGVSADWAIYVKGMPGLDRAIKLNIPYGILEREPTYAITHEAPAREASREFVSSPARADVPQVSHKKVKPQPQQSPPKPAAQPPLERGDIELDKDH